METNISKSNKNEGEVFFSKLTSQKKSLINTQYLQEVSEGNSSFINAMLHAFCEESLVFITQMERVLVNNDFLSIKRIAHRMKPSGAYIGVDSLTVLVRNLEQAADKTDPEEARSVYNNIENLLKNILNEIDGYLGSQPSLA